MRIYFDRCVNATPAGNGLRLKMNEDIKKTLRTQGKYTVIGDSKHKEKHKKDSPSEKGPPEKKSQLSKNSNESHSTNPWTDTSDKESPVKYEENSNYKFKNLDPKKTPEEIQSSGMQIISETRNGVSSILYEPDFIELDEGNELYDTLMEEINWDERDIVIRGQKFPQPRLVAWYGPFPYTYSGLTLEAAEIPVTILPLKQRIEDYLSGQGIKVTFNSVLLNLYRSGHDSVSWHSDDELSMGICPTIASISLGETRKFEMKRKKESYDENIASEDVEQFFMNLMHGSLLIMNGVMQIDWQHRIPKEYHDKDGRINLTFRTVYSLDKDPLEPAVRINKSKCIEDSSSIKSFGEKSFNADDFPPLNSPVTASTDNLPSKKSCKPNNIQTDGNQNKSIDSIPESDVNDLNDEVHIKHVFDKNVNTTDSFASDSDITNNDENIVEDNSAYEGDVETQTYMKKFENKMYADKIETNFNVEAPEFVPTNLSPVISYENNYKDLSFSDLISVEIDAFDQQKFQDYTDVLKEKALQNLSAFTLYHKDEIMFLIDLIEGSKCEYTQKLVRNRLIIVAKQLDRGYKRYPRDKPFPMRENHSNLQGESHNSSQRQRFSYGKSRNRDENSSQGDSFSNNNNRRRFTPQNQRLSTSKKENYNQKDPWSKGHVNLGRNSKDDSAWIGEDVNRNNKSANKDIGNLIGEHSTKTDISTNDHVSNWIETLSTSNTDARKADDTWDDEDFSKSNTNAKKSDDSWVDEDFSKSNVNKSEGIWDVDNCNDGDERLHNRERNYDDNSNRERTFNKIEPHSWNDRSSREDRHFDRNEGGRYVKSSDRPSNYNRHFNKDNRHPLEDEDSSKRERFENADRRGFHRGGNFSRGRFHQRDENSFRGENRHFNKGENQFNRDYNKGFGAKYAKKSPDYSRNNEEQFRDSRFHSLRTRPYNRRGISGQPPRFTRRDDVSNKEAEPNKDDYISPTWDN